MDFIWGLGLLILAIFMGPLYVHFSQKVPLLSDWRNSNRESAKIAADPLTNLEALVQVYSARTFSWRGLFSTHCWIAIKPASAKHYITYQVAGWRKYSNLPVLVIEQDIPDRYWFGNKPELVKEIRGPLAELIMTKIAELSEHYPHRYDYTMWPGPNSNSYIAYIARHIPELKVEMPSIALGKDYLIDSHFFGTAPSGTGYQFSIKGLLGILIAKVEGIEINFITQVIGISWYKGLAIKWPGLGKIYLFRQNKQKLESLSRT